jgi:heparanase 1
LKLPRGWIATLPPDYLSLAIDASLIVGGHWWGGSKGLARGVAKDRTAPLDLRDARLSDFARALAPAMLRIGGTEADRIGYRVKMKWSATLGVEGGEGGGRAPEYLLEKRMWRRIIDFSSRTGFPILFVIGAGPASRDETGAWDGGNAGKLIAHAAAKGLPVGAWELGNEINGYPFVHGFKHRVRASRYAQDFAAFSRMVRELHPAARAVGPGSSVWPVIGELNPILPAFARSGALAPGDVLSWHYYPLQSSRGALADRRAREGSLLSARRLDSALGRSRAVRELAQGREIWLTETGHALYGGEPGLSDRHCSSLWWLDQLGLLAREGVGKVFRQSLIGSDYGLLDEEGLEPRPDYYASLLWKRLMGGAVFEAPIVEGPDRRLRAYRHSSSRGDGSSCVLLINLSQEPARAILDGRLRERYTVAPAEGLRSTRVLLNGVPVEEDLALDWKTARPPRAYCAAENDGSEIVMPGYAYAFLIVELPSPRGRH